MKYKKPKVFTMDEMRHLAVNYTITCLNGYNGSFDDWYNNISKDWKKIANKPLTKTEERIIKIKKLFPDEIR